MATLYSVERTNSTAVPPIPNNANTKGRLMAAYFSLNTTTITVTTSDSVELCKIPAGARVVGGHITFGAMGAGATALIGVSGDTDKYKGSTDVAAIGSADLATTQALNFGSVTTAEETILLTPGGANYAAAKDLTGYISYISAGQ